MHKGTRSLNEFIQSSSHPCACANCAGGRGTQRCARACTECAYARSSPSAPSSACVSRSSIAPPLCCTFSMVMMVISTLIQNKPISTYFCARAVRMGEYECERECKRELDHENACPLARHYVIAYLRVCVFGLFRVMVR